MEWKNLESICFIDTNKTKVNSETYMKLLKEGLLSDCVALYSNRDYIFQQHGASSHTSKATQSYLDEATPGLIKKKIGHLNHQTTIQWIT